MLLEFQNLPQTILFVKFHRKCDYLPVNLICKIIFGLIVIKHYPVGRRNDLENAFRQRLLARQ